MMLPFTLFISKGHPFDHPYEHISLSHVHCDFQLQTNKQNVHRSVDRSLEFKSSHELLLQSFFCIHNLQLHKKHKYVSCSSEITFVAMQFHLFNLIFVLVCAVRCIEHKKKNSIRGYRCVKVFVFGIVVVVVAIITLYSNLHVANIGSSMNLSANVSLE